MFMERYKLSRSQLEEEINLNPAWFAEAYKLNVARIKLEQEKMGNIKMGDKLQGHDKRVQRWSQHRHSSSTTNIMMGNVALEKKFPGMMN